MSTSSDWAAWVQAIGSIAAIIAAFAISNRQFKSSLNLQRLATAEGKKAQQGILRAMLDSSLKELEEIYVAALQKNTRWLNEYSVAEMAKQIHRSFSSVSPFDAPNLLIAQCMIQIQNQCEMASWNVDVITENISSDLAKANRGIEALKDNIDELREILKTI